MNPPPSKEIFQRLMNNELESLGFYRFEVHLDFENGNRLSFSAPFRFAEEHSLLHSALQEFPLVESTLLRVLGCRIHQMDCEKDGTLMLKFSNSDVLIVYANDPAYEAYTLFIDGKRHIV